LVIFNPAAGNGRAKRCRPALEQLLDARGIEAEFALTRAPGHARELIHDAPLQRFDAVAAAGGDGTLFEVVNGLKQHPGAGLPLGVVPVGTGNAFARDLGLCNRNWRQAVDIIKAGQLRVIDLAYFEARGASGHFINVLGSGFVADVAALARRLKALGNFAYTVAIFLRLAALKPRPIELQIDGRRLRRDNLFVEVCNSRYTADFLIAPEALLEDGLLDVVLLNRCSRLRLIANFRKVLNGTHLQLPEVEMFKARQVSISSSQASALTPDGEVLGSTPVTIRCEQSSLPVFWPPG
jgi:diacylglycerol kinase (ATP)